MQRATVLSVVPTARKRGNGQKLEKKTFYLNIIYCESDEALAQVVQRHCTVYLLGDLQNSPGHGPGQCFRCLFLSWGVDQLTIQMWFCETGTEYVIFWTLLKFHLTDGLTLIIMVIPSRSVFLNILLTVRLQEVSIGMPLSNK